MKRSFVQFLKLAILFIGFFVLAVMIRFPQTEGRASNLDLVSIYSDPFIIYIYIATIPFFAGLYQAFKLVSYIGRNQIFSKYTINTLKNIRNCALILTAFIIGAAAFIILTFKTTIPDDDPAGFIALCIFTTIASGSIALASSIFATLLQKKVRK